TAGRSGSPDRWQEGLDGQADGRKVWTARQTAGRSGRPGIRPEGPGDQAYDQKVRATRHMTRRSGRGRGRGRGRGVLPSKTVTLSITPPADAPVGEYELFGKLQDEEKSLGKLVVLFNPWCSEDSVHLSDDLKRQEYILNEHGIIFKGSANYIFRANWDYGQFEENMVDICLKILDRNLKHDENPAEDVASRSDPIYVSRVISAMINSDDDSGVLEGLWEFPYTGGKRPTHWTGSYAILNKWLQSHLNLHVTLMRLLGIPCRVVTNFNSACDDNMNLIIETYKDDDGKGGDVNFHVWTEGWMKRPDLGSDGEYDGWQAVDPTPQELSDGVYCCGPASVKSILNGHTELQYDVAFIYAEVNADYIVWRSGEKIQCKCDTKKVGKHISTKAVGSSERLDITNTYKYKEGISHSVIHAILLNSLTSGEVVFTNPINAILTNCTLTLSGCGLIEDLKPNDTMSIKFDFTPYKKGEKTLTADFDCDTFRDIKAICTVNVIE
uniref:Transglutaminase-like domain-containing protein n=1 Tax=Acanthochromis polyacanthus TaxID=80966 RepID=A0A3Q1EZK0_9TELE